MNEDIADLLFRIRLSACGPPKAEGIRGGCSEQRGHAWERPRPALTLCLWAAWVAGMGFRFLVRLGGLGITWLGACAALGMTCGAAFRNDERVTCLYLAACL